MHTPAHVAHEVHHHGQPDPEALRGGLEVGLEPVADEGGDPRAIVRHPATHMISDLLHPHLYAPTVTTILESIVDEVGPGSLQPWRMPQGGDAIVVHALQPRLGQLQLALEILQDEVK